MSLISKITVSTVDQKAKFIILTDVTGAYNSITNPGGYGTPNYATTDVSWALLLLRNYDDDNYTTLQYNSIADFLASGQLVNGVNDPGIFKDGTWELKYYPVIGRPVNPSVDTTITWTVGSKTFNLSSANTILAGAFGIVIKDISQTKIYTLDPNTPPTSGQATVTEMLPSAGTGKLAVTYEAASQFLTTSLADSCLAKKTEAIVRECSCFDPEMQEILLRMGKRNGADIHFSQGNYQAAHDIITQLASYCNDCVPVSTPAPSNCNCQ